MKKEIADAVATINRTIAGIRRESEDDEGAAEWHGHLESIKESLVTGTMTVKQAEKDLGLSL